MNASPKPLVAGNWKMNGGRAALNEIAAVAAGYDVGLARDVDVMICPPATLLFTAAVAAVGTGIEIGAQDCHTAAAGAHTGDISAPMLRDAGARAVIVGHSERRADHHESDAMVRAKAEAAWAAGLMAIVCLGETESQRKAGRTLEVISGQLAGSLPDGATAANTIIAYEPVWAIGTGLTPTPDDVSAAHAALRGDLAKRLGGEGAAIRLLYGGSVKPGNAAELMALDNVDGALVGGASLKAEDFLGIIRTYAT